MAKKRANGEGNIYKRDMQATKHHAEMFVWLEGREWFMNSVN